jgi:hypothetical protein
MGPDARRSLATVLVVLTSALLAAATVAGYAQRALFDSDQFADRASSTLADSSVRSLVADRVTDEVVLRHQADLLSARPIIASAISGVVGGSAFRSLFRRAALDVHRAVFERDQDTVVLTIADVGTVVATALRALRPELARQVQDSGRVEVVDRDVGSVSGKVARIARDVRVLAFVFAALTLAAAVAALVVAPDRRRTASQLGVGIAAVGVVVVLAYTIARAVVLGRFHDPDERAAAGAVWGAFLGDLRTWGFLLAGTGAVMAAAAASLVRPVVVEGTLLRAWRVATTEPDSTRLRVARAVALIVVGVFVIAQPLTALQVAAMLVGLYVAYKGIEAILRLVYVPPEPGAVGEPEPEPERPAPKRARARRVAVPALATLLAAGIVAAVLGSGGASAPAAAIVACDGHAALCDKRLDEVVLPATHNSMSAPLKGWFASEQDRSIGGQLEDGVRGLLLDTHYGDRLSNDRVRTVFESKKDLDLIKDQDGVSDESFAAALRLRERLGFSGKGKRGIYLCHTLCELGATTLASALEDIHEFLVTHPSDVVVVVNQDYVPPAAIVEAVKDAGLARYALTPPDDGTWPTLRQMIEDDQRLVFLAENHAGTAPWYQLAYKRQMQETPYSFPRASLLTKPASLPASCRANRGPSDAPLFLINHWVSTDPTPRPSDADKVNAYKPLLARARACERIRHHLPNLLAVNFYKRGDVFRVVDTLNGV